MRTIEQRHYYCEVEGCLTRVKNKKYPRCAEHAPFVECLTPGCTSREFYHGLCKMCYHMGEARKCTLEECERRLYAKGLCWTHYYRQMMNRKNLPARAKRQALLVLKEIIVDSDKIKEQLGSEDPEEIMTGLAEIVKIQTERLAKLLEEEKEGGTHMKAADRLATALFQQATALAKLRNPKLTGHGDSKHLHLHLKGQPKELTAQAVAALERQGVRREDITQDMIIKQLEQQNAVIEE